METKFIRAAQALPLGSWRDGWLVVWCQPDRQRVLWHVMLLRPGSSFEVAAIEGGSVQSINAPTTTSPRQSSSHSGGGHLGFRISIPLHR